MLITVAVGPLKVIRWPEVRLVWHFISSLSTPRETLHSLQATGAGRWWYLTCSLGTRACAAIIMTLAWAPCSAVSPVACSAWGARTSCKPTGAASPAATVLEP